MRCFSAFQAILLALVTAPLLGQVNPVPFINKPLMPGAIQPGEEKFVLTVNGTGFVPGATVNWNRTARRTTFINSSRLITEISRSEIAVPKTALITVTNPGPGGGTSNPVPFAVTTPSSTIAFTRLKIPLPAGATVILAGDFNNDGKLDLAIGGNCAPPLCVSSFPNPIEGMVSVFLGKGDGRFTAVPPFPVAGVPQIIVAGNFENDGNQDLAVAARAYCMGCAEINLFRGHGDGTFAAGSKLFTIDGGYLDMTAADFNRDGNVDLVANVVTSPLPFGLTLLGNGAGAFVQEDWAESGEVPWPEGSLAVADLNGDGILDLAAMTPFGADGFLAFTGNGDGIFSPLWNGPLTNQSPTKGPLLLGDFTSNGTVDVLHPDPTSGNLLVYRGNGNGTFSLIHNQPLAGSLMNSVSDWNGDGILDVASVDPEGNLNLYLGNGDGTFQPAGTPAAGLTAGGPVAVADFNRDGRPDLVYYNQNDGTVNILLQTQGYVATVEPPLSPTEARTYKASHESIPVRFSLTQYGNSTCILPPAKISLTETDGNSPGPVPERLYVTHPDDGNHFGTNPGDCKYTYKLATESLAPGTYQIQISLYGIGVGTATFKLK